MKKQVAQSFPSRSTVTRSELLVEGRDTAFRSFIHDFLAFSHRVAQCRTRFGEQIGLSGASYTALISIAHLQGEEGIGVSRVAEHLHLSGAFVTIEVAKLVKAGLVTKRLNGQDRRRVLLTVTEKGRQALEDLVPVQAPVNDALFGVVSEEEFRLLADLMRRLAPCGDRALALLSLLTENPDPAAGPPPAASSAGTVKAPA